MTEIVHRMTRGWRELARDEPGRRFINHYCRSQRRYSLRSTAARIALGAVLMLVGMALWFLPGPGWLFVILGLAMLAGEFRALAQLLDRAECTVREQAHRMRRWWRARRGRRR
jgi:hypothetical protein